MIFFYLVVVIIVLIAIEIILKERTCEYCCTANSTIYKYICKVRTLESDKIYHILQSTKDASFIGVTEEQLKNNFKESK